jgi:alkylation response protein AidB-like acyl-CoA dehydrogenase
MFTDAFEDFLRGHCAPSDVRALESGGAYRPMWESLAESGFLELMAPEDAGGAGLDLSGTLPILRTIGAHAVPLPVGDAIVLRALMPAARSVPAGIPALAPAVVRTLGGGVRAVRVPYGAIADWIVAEFDQQLWLLDARAATRQSVGVHHDSTADLTWSASDLNEAMQVMGFPFPDGSLLACAAAVNAALMDGALVRSFELTLQYANERTQFGKAIGRNQAIQHQLAVMAEHVAAARMAVASAFPAGRQIPATLPAAIAKARASEAASLTAPIAHAVHGAIGVTEEYDLQLLTRRLHMWRLAHGSENYWHRVVGEALLDAEHMGVVDFVRWAPRTVSRDACAPC